MFLVIGRDIKNAECMEVGGLEAKSKPKTSRGRKMQLSEAYLCLFWGSDGAPMVTDG